MYYITKYTNINFIEILHNIYVYLSCILYHVYAHHFSMLYFAYIYIYIRTFKEMDAPKNMDTSRSLARISER